MYGFESKVKNVTEEVANLLIEKNRKYGNAALDPIRVFSKSDSLEQINVRIDDKLSRMQSGQLDDDEDVELDLLGYLILRRIARREHELLLSAD